MQWLLTFLIILIIAFDYGIGEREIGKLLLNFLVNLKITDICAINYISSKAVSYTIQMIIILFKISNWNASTIYKWNYMLFLWKKYYKFDWFDFRHIYESLLTVMDLSGFVQLNYYLMLIQSSW